jgi:hypothetical protein
MIWLHYALSAIVLAGVSVGRRVASPVFSGSRLPAWLDHRLGWNQAADEHQARDAERSHEQSPRGKDASTDW